MKIGLIFPRLNDSIDKLYDESLMSQVFKKRFGLGETNLTPPLSLLVLAALTPDDFDVDIIDERIEDIKFDSGYDLIGISIVTRSAIRSYKIADKFRNMGTKVIVGGIHPSILPEEAANHADVVVVGDGESVWREILSDFINNKLKEIYISNNNSKMMTPYKYKLLKNPEKYITTNVLVATRGCSNYCTFCSAGLALGKEYRTRNIQEIIKEIESEPSRYVVFLDDNMGCDKEFAKALLKKMEQLNIKWGGEMYLPALEDQELLDLLARSGCQSLGIGFESLSSETLKSIGKSKSNNPEMYPQIIKNLHDRGIQILGHFIIGFDTDTYEIFENISNFLESNPIEMPSINILVPYPGSKIYKQFDREERILTKDWAKYDTAEGNIIYQPKLMTREGLWSEYVSLAEKVYSSKKVLKRLLMAKNVDFLRFAFAWHYNAQQKQTNSIIRTGST